MSLVSKLVVHSIIGAPSTDQIDYALNYRRTEAAFVLVDFGPNAPLRLRRWLRVKVSGQGPPKPSPSAEAQRSFSRAFSLNFGLNAPLRLRRWAAGEGFGAGAPKPSPAAEAQRDVTIELD